MLELRSLLKENLGLQTKYEVLSESILLDEGIKDLAKKGFKLLGKTKNIAKSFLKKSWRPAVLLLLAAAGAYAGEVDMSSYIERLNELFSSGNVEIDTVKNLLGMFIDALHSSDIPLDDAQQIVDQVEVFKNLGETGDKIVDIIYHAKDTLADKFGK